MDLGINGRIAVVTGGDSGIGLATAKQLLIEGCRVALLDIAGDELVEAAKTLDADDRLMTVTADLTVRSETERAAREIRERFGDADILVNAAGITGAKGDPLEMSDDDWSEAWNVDFMSAVRTARAFMPAMRKAGWGRVVFVTSENAVQAYPDEMVYNVAKAALLNLTSGLAHAYAPDGVLINAVGPAFIETPMTDGMMKKRATEQGVSFEEAVASFLKEERPYLALKRRGRAEEVAAVIAFLCSERASFVLGSNYRVDGGAVVGMDT